MGRSRGPFLESLQEAITFLYGRVTWRLRLEWQQGRCGEGDSPEKYLGMRISRTCCLRKGSHPSGSSSPGCHVSVLYMLILSHAFPSLHESPLRVPSLTVAIMSLIYGCP